MKKKKMNLPNKITMARLVLSVAVIVLLMLDLNTPTYSLMGVENVDLKYIICGVLFLIGSVTDFLDGYIARSRNLVTDFGKVMDAIADKVLVNGVLIILADKGFLPVLVPVIIITRDIAVDSIKMVSGSKGKVIAASWPGKIKTICMMVGVTLTLFYNMPFSLFSVRIDELFVFVAVVMSIISGCQYYLANKDYIFDEI